MDKIIMKDMQFYGYHGVLAEEQRLGQRFVVDVELFLDLEPAGKSDDLTKTISYADVYRLVEDIITKSKFKLIEAAAEAVAGQLIQKFKPEKVTVRVKKPQTPIAGCFAHMAVEITRSAKEG